MATHVTGERQRQTHASRGALGFVALAVALLLLGGCQSPTAPRRCARWCA
jgi:hypothetical protein